MSDVRNCFNQPPEFFCGASCSGISGLLQINAIRESITTSWINDVIFSDTGSLDKFES
jgi:hypothetical protein